MALPLLLCVVGPTAVGKTGVGTQLAARFGTEALSVDARQVYRGLAIGTNQPSDEEQTRARHHLVGFVDPGAAYNAADYVRDALEVLETLFRHQPVVLAVGGTGFYLKALLEGLDEMPAVPPAVRQALRAQHAEGGLAPLVEELRQADPEAAAAMDVQNPARVLRALEVIRASGRPVSQFRRNLAVDRPFRSVVMGLELPRAELHARIAARTDAMLAAGWLNEVRALQAAGYTADSPGLRTIGYGELLHHLAGELPLDEAQVRIVHQTRQYAKRQLTWFRGQHTAQWFHPAEESAIFAYADAHVAAQN